MYTVNAFFKLTKKLVNISFNLCNVFGIFSNITFK